jgi:cell division protease FtsH
MNNRKSGEEYIRIPLSDFLQAVKNKQIRTVTIHQYSGAAVGTYSKSKQQVMTYFPSKQSFFIKSLLDSGAGVEIVYPSEATTLWVAFFNWLPNLILIAVIIYSNLGRFGFGKSRNKRADNLKKVTFDDVAGLPEVKSDLKEIIDFLRNPAEFTKVGARIPRGVLLYGPPGTGKTLLARAISGEAGVPFLYTSGSEFTEMFVGVGASRVRSLFGEARKSAPCIIYIDEVDSLAKRRDMRFSMNDEREGTLNQLLVELDGFEKSEGIVVIMSTNRYEVLDPALLRPGRVDREIEIPLPYAKERFEILSTHLRNLRVDPEGMDLRPVVQATSGCSGAELANIINESAIRAGREKRKYVTRKDVIEAMDKIMLGGRSSIKMKKTEVELTAHHEAGHVIASVYSETSDPIFKATIIPTSKALGMVVNIPDDESFSFSKQQAYDRLSVLMAGRIGEEMHVGANKITSGAASDFEQATKIAYKMVAEWGMDDEMGHIRIDVNTYISEYLRAEIEKKVQDILNNVTIAQL